MDIGKKAALCPPGKRCLKGSGTARRSRVITRFRPSPARPASVCNPAALWIRYPLLAVAEVQLERRPVVGLERAGPSDGVHASAGVEDAFAGRNAHHDTDTPAGQA